MLLFQGFLNKDVWRNLFNLSVYLLIKVCRENFSNPFKKFQNIFPDVNRWGLSASMTLAVSLICMKLVKHYPGSFGLLHTRKLVITRAVLCSYWGYKENGFAEEGQKRIGRFAKVCSVKGIIVKEQERSRFAKECCFRKSATSAKLSPPEVIQIEATAFHPYLLF